MEFDGLKSRRTLMILALILATTPWAAGLAKAQTKMGSLGSECRTIIASAARLACYDKDFGTAVGAESALSAALAPPDKEGAAGDEVVLNRAQSEEIRRQSFGFNIPALSSVFKASKNHPPEDNRRVLVKVSEVRLNGLGNLTVTVEGGAVWRQIDDVSLSIPPRPGDTIEIRKAALGSYFLIFRGQSAVRVHRDQ